MLFQLLLMGVVGAQYTIFQIKILNLKYLCKTLECMFQKRCLGQIIFIVTGYYQIIIIRIAVIQGQPQEIQLLQAPCSSCINSNTFFKTAINSVINQASNFSILCVQNGQNMHLIFAAIQFKWQTSVSFYTQVVLYTWICYLSIKHVTFSLVFLDVVCVYFLKYYTALHYNQTFWIWTRFALVIQIKYYQSYGQPR
eukprot:TRINITY_DN20881_c0_g1_i2.p3 TRINITY_DN20881_c0_g1~~TRINITY_DN20881_c0_g1_i2.p3  ORF type:complete len:196 (+),score=-19.16 TRINITY_DN20881_c0_g1_i2:378-965(+)